MTDRLLAFITDRVFLCDPPAKADIIFIPGGSYPELPEHAARLYREGFAPLALPTGRFSARRRAFPGPKAKAARYPGPYETEHAFMADVLRKNGVPEEAVLREDRARRTRQNAFFSRAVTDARGLTVNRAIIVCKAFHARRCLTLWRHAYPATEFFVCPVSPDGVTRENWYRTKRGRRCVLSELAHLGPGILRKR